MEALDPLLRTAQRGAARAPRAGALALALLVPLACATPRDPGAASAARSNAEAALDLYEAGEFPLAAERFASASRQAAWARDDALERRALVGECLAWLHARRLPELAGCSRRLEELQRRARRPDPAVNTLVALGSVAGHRPLPDLRLPRSVRPVVRAAAGGGR